MLQPPVYVAPLIAAGQDLEARTADNREQTALHIAVYARRFDMARCLLEHGANPNVLDGNGKTAADIAAAANYRHIADQLRQALSTRAGGAHD